MTSAQLIDLLAAKIIAAIVLAEAKHGANDKLTRELRGILKDLEEMK
jgi:hypothetical protein